MDNKAFNALSYGVHLLTSEADGKANGCIVNTVCQVASSPPTLSVAVSKNNYTQQLIASSGKFAVMPLVAKAGMDFIGRFGFHSGRDLDKFDGLPYRKDEQGLAYVADMAAARFSCRVTNRVDVGSHVLFIGQVYGAERLSGDDAMTYAYYHQVKNGVTPPNSPSYQSETQQEGWRCALCGYVYEGEELPEGFSCPRCGSVLRVFEKIG